MRLLPRDEKFFALFQKQVGIISEAARLLADGVRIGDGRMASAATEISVLEHRGDELIHEVFTRLNQTFITPIDPEDIHAISSALDDVLDGIEDTAHRLVAYHINPIPANMVSLAEIVARCAKQLQQAFELEGKGSPQVYCIEINRLENESDRLSRTLIAQLFDEERDPVQIIKWKEIIEVIETAVDKCEDVANVIESVTIKNS